MKVHQKVFAVKKLIVGDYQVVAKVFFLSFIASLLKLLTT